MEKKLFDVYYTKSDGLECKVRYYCLDKEEAGKNLRQILPWKAVSRS